jgi:hypothetical protein
VETSGWAQRGFYLSADIEFIENFHQECSSKERLITCYHFMYINVLHDKV